MAVLLAHLKVPLTWREIFRRTFKEAFWEDNCLGMAAQLAYYFFFALFPALLFLLALASYFPIDTLIDDMFRTMGGFVPPEVLTHHHGPDQEDLRRRADGSAHPRYARRPLEQLGGDDGHHRHAEQRVRRRGRAAVVEGPHHRDRPDDRRGAVHPGVVRAHPGRAAQWRS